MFLTDPTINRINDINTQLKQKFQINTTLLWIPSHVGIEGNEESDKLAKAAVNLPVDNISPMMKTTTDCYHEIELLIHTEWQTRYDQSTFKSWYKALQPTVNKQIKYTAKSRKEEISITRLRLGHIRTNERLYKMKRHDTGNCRHCNIPENTEHLLTCTQNNIMTSDEYRQITDILKDPQKCHNL